VLTDLEELAFEGGACIYAIVNTAAGKAYIGSTNNPNNRKKQHYRKLLANSHINPKFQASWNSYGPKAFRFIIIANCSLSDQYKIEQLYLDKYAGKLLNVAMKAETPPRFKDWSEASRQAFRQKIKARHLDPAFRLAVSEGVKRAWADPVWRAERLAQLRWLNLDPAGAARRGRTNLGRLASEETRIKRSLAMLKTLNEPSYREAMLPVWREKLKTQFAKPEFMEAHRLRLAGRVLDSDYMEKLRTNSRATMQKLNSSSEFREKVGRILSDKLSKEVLSFAPGSLCGLYFKNKASAARFYGLSTTSVLNSSNSGKPVKGVQFCLT